jgi:DNA-binding NtrC family response regulator
MQAALLRFLDDRKARSVGGTQSRRICAQLLASTRADLDVDAATRRFCADLLYWFNTVYLALPPLHQRNNFAAALRDASRHRSRRPHRRRGGGAAVRACATRQPPRAALGTHARAARRRLRFSGVPRP